MRGDSSPCGEDSDSGIDAADVIRGCLAADENVVAVVLGLQRESTYKSIETLTDPY